jgi:glycosyltransferase involved in cell wall biosynthesis
MDAIEPSTPAALTRMDTHCHSWASDGPAVAALSFIGVPECYSPPEKVYDQAKARGMDLFTLTDHDTIKGAMELVDRGFPGVIVGQEVTVCFPEDRCKLHVLVWGLTPTHDEELTRLGLRGDVYAFANWLYEHKLAHSLAHPLYMQNGRLTRWHVERCALLFKGFEILNGAHTDRHRFPLERFLDGLTPGRVQQLVKDHGLEPVWPRIWQKARTAGSDDHGLLNIGRTWTGVRGEDGRGVTDPAEFMRIAMTGRCQVGGEGGHSALLAHQLTTVGAHYYADRLAERQSVKGRYVASKLLRFAGVDLPRPSRARLAAHLTKRRLIRRKKFKSLPLLNSLRESLSPVLDRYPDLRARLSSETWDDGAALADHERMAAFADELTALLTRELGGSSLRALRKKDKSGLVDHALSYAILTTAQLPYVFSLFYQNKERDFIERFEHETGRPGDGVSVLERPMRVSLFTDTLGDVNGVSRFIGDVAQRARATGRDLQVITSTKMQVPPAENIFNFEPVYSTAMPRYQNLEVVLPPLIPMLRHLDKHQPDCIHISTPGPVGLVGFIAAKMLKVPVLGVYHTDFPSYIDNLFEDRAFTVACEKFMRFFYKPFWAIFTRSEDYVDALGRLGLPRERCCALMPGFEHGSFHPRFRHTGIWEQHPAIDPESTKVLYVGRVSVEKNLPFLTGVWKQTQHRLKEQGLNAELIVVGDGPYRERMTQELRRERVHFLGFRRGEELSRLYASSDMFVFPSVTDTLGQVVMESQGSGLPVLVTDQGGPKEVVEDGSTGYVLPVTNVNAWVERIVGLVADPERRRRMGVAAHMSMQKYSLANSFEHFWEVHTRAWREHSMSRGLEPREPEAPAKLWDGPSDDEMDDLFNQPRRRDTQADPA